jgi:hypothetical protein
LPDHDEPDEGEGDEGELDEAGDHFAAGIKTFPVYR